MNAHNEKMYKDHIALLELKIKAYKEVLEVYAKDDNWSRRVFAYCVRYTCKKELLEKGYNVARDVLERFK